MFDECAGNFSHKRLRALVWLIVVIAFFALLRQFYVSRIDRGRRLHPPAAPEPSGGSIVTRDPSRGE